jgi:LysR family transcriptional activator of nhaA
VEEDVMGKCNVRVIKRTDAVRERFYAISAERRITHPAVATVTSAACTDLFV